MDNKEIAHNNVSCWWCFRIVFVLFSLYLMGDVFYRWDGFSYYGTFLDFLPSVSLITILFSIFSLFTAMFLWTIARALNWAFTCAGLKIKTKHIIVFLISLSILVLLMMFLWYEKRTLFDFIRFKLSLFQLKLFLCFSLTLVSMFITWVIRNKLSFIQERITPLVWLFGLCFFISVPIVVFQTWLNETDEVVLRKTSELSVVQRNRPNILLVTFDALRAESMSVYSPQKETTPFMSKWVKEATVFEKAEAEGNYTFPTTISLMSGKRLWTHKHYHSHGFESNKTTENIPFLLKKNGYYNMMYSANKVASNKGVGISDSFEIAPNTSQFYSASSLLGALDLILCRLFCDKIKLHDWILKEDFILYRFIMKIPMGNTTLFPPELVFNRFLADIDKNPPEPFFAWLHLMPPHDPYLPAEEYKGMFNSSPELRTSKSQVEAINKIRSYNLDENPSSEEIQRSLHILRDRYEEYIRYCDKQFEDFMIQLTKRNKLNNTVVIVSADHGESFEHDYPFHGGHHVFEQVTNIPLIIKEPHQIDGRRIDDWVEQIDIPATILDFANIAVPSWMEGRSLIPLIHGETLPYRPLYSMALSLNRRRDQPIVKGTFATWENEYKLIYYYNYYSDKKLLFNLNQDPDELNNIFDEKYEIGQRLLNRIQNKLKEVNKNINREK